MSVTGWARSPTVASAEAPITTWPSAEACVEVSSAAFQRAPMAASQSWATQAVLQEPKGPIAAARPGQSATCASAAATVVTPACAAMAGPRHASPAKRLGCHKRVLVSCTLSSACPVQVALDAVTPATVPSRSPNWVTMTLTPPPGWPVRSAAKDVLCAAVPWVAQAAQVWRRLAGRAAKWALASPSQPWPWRAMEKVAASGAERLAAMPLSTMLPSPELVGMKASTRVETAPPSRAAYPVGSGVYVNVAESTPSCRSMSLSITVTGTVSVVSAVSVVTSAQPQAKWPARTPNARAGPTGASTTGSMPAGAVPVMAPGGSPGRRFWATSSAQVVPATTLAVQVVTVRCP